MPPYLRVVDPSACLNGSKIVACSSDRDADAGVGDREVQRARGSPPRSSSRTRTTTSPRSVNLIALPTRLIKDLPQRLGSPTMPAGTSASTSTAARALSGARGRRTASACSASVSPQRRTPTASSSSLPASIFEKSRMSLMIVSSESAELFDRREIVALIGGQLACRAPARSCRSSPFIGVRISWLMLARNSLFARLAFSAASLLPASSCCSSAGAVQSRMTVHEADRTAIRVAIERHRLLQ